MRARDYGFLLLLCAALFLPGLWLVPPIDRDEPRFAQASRQMLESGDYVNIRFQDEPRLKKPVGIYWLQAASAALFSEAGDGRIWPYRVPSTFGATLAVLLTAAIAARLFGRAVGWTAAVMLATSLLLGVEARLAKTDAVLLATVCAAQLALARAYFERDSMAPPGHATPALFWAALGLGILVKGPIIVMVSGLTAAALALWDRRACWLGRLRAWPYGLLALLVVAPWGIAIMLQTKGAFLAESVGGDLMAKVAGAQEAHGAPPGFFAVTFWATFWPFSLLAGLAVPWVWRHRQRPAARFCIAWILPSWLIFELVPTKLAHYTLPLFPAIAILAARAAFGGVPAPLTRLGQLVQAVVIGGCLALTLALCAALPLLPELLEGRLDAVAILAGVAAMLLFATAWRVYRAGRGRDAVAALLAACLVFYGAGYDRVIPRLDSLWVGTRAAVAVQSGKRCPHPVVTAAGISEPSLVFLLGTGTRFRDGNGAAEALLEDPCALALVDRPYLGAFDAQLARAGKTAPALATIEGFNMARGKRVTLTLFGAPRAPAGS